MSKRFEMSFFQSTLCLALQLSGLLLLGGARLHAQTPTAAETSALSAREYFIEVKQAALRKEPKHWAAVLEALSFGDKVDLVTSNGDWLRVRRASGLEGYIHKTALTTRVVVLKGATNQNRVKGDEREIVLAGKGFSADVEGHYRMKDRESDFATVDLIEARRISPAVVAKFVEEGGFTPPFEAEPLRDEGVHG